MGIWFRNFKTAINIIRKSSIHDGVAKTKTTNDDDYGSIRNFNANSCNHGCKK